jgi:hypothetical protein
MYIRDYSFLQHIQKRLLDWGKDFIQFFTLELLHIVRILK